MESKKHVDDYQHAFLEMLEPEVIMKEDPLSNDLTTTEEDHSRSNEDSFNSILPDVSENDEINDHATIEDLQTDIIKEEPQMKHEGQLFSCTRCKYETTSRRNFRNHLKAKHGGEKFPCYHCDYESVWKGDLKRHIQSVHEGKKIQCPHCDYKASEKGNLQRHIQSVHEDNKFSCTLCKYETTAKRNFHYHMKARHQIMKSEEVHSMTTLNEEEDSLSDILDDIDPLEDDAEIEDLERNIDRIKQELVEHDRDQIKKIRESQKFSCLHCDYKTNWISSLQTHIRTVHEREKFQWPVSNLKIEENNSPQIRTDVERKVIREEGEKFACPQCDYKSTEKRSLQTHIRSIHEGRKFQCKHCTYNATWPGDLQKHVKSVHDGQKFTCPYCGHQATQKGHLRRHIQSVHEGLKFPCPHCEYQATQKGNLQTHIKSSHGSEYRSSLSNLKKQIHSEEVNSSTSSTQNEDSFHKTPNAENIALDDDAGIEELKTDINGIVKQEEVKKKKKKKFKKSRGSLKIPCPHCDYKSTLTASLQEHIKTVHSCVDTMSGDAVMEELKMEIEYDEEASLLLEPEVIVKEESELIPGDLKFSCTYCEYEATAKHQLRYHIKKVHEGQRFPCTQCSYVSAQKGDLQIHIKSVHEGQRFQCPYCEHKSTQYNNLQRHIKSIHEGQKFPCPHCEYEATQKGNLKTHIKSRHSET